MRAVRVAGAVAGVAGVLSLVPWGSTPAATLVAAGWWTQAPQAEGAPDPTLPPLPAPAIVPLPQVATPTPREGQLQVAGVPAGAVSVAAVRFSLVDGEVPSSLVLEVSSGETSFAAMVACPVAKPWTPAEAGAFDQRPTCLDGAPQAPGVPDPNRVFYEFALTPDMARDGFVDLAVYPAQLEGADGIGAPFTVNLNAPTDRSLRTSGGESGGGTTTDTTLGSTTADTTATTAAPASSGGDVTSVGGGPVVEPATGGTTFEPAPATTTAATPSITSGDGPRLVAAPAAPRRALRRTSASRDDDRARNLGLILFPLAGVAAIAAFNAKVPGITGIGPLAKAGDGDVDPEESSGGLARFRRVRTTPADPLR